MRTAGIVIIAITVLGMAFSLLRIAVIGAGVSGPVIVFMNIVMSQVGRLVWVFIGLGFIAMQDKLDRLESRLPRPPRMQNIQ